MKNKKAKIILMLSMLILIGGAIPIYAYSGHFSFNIIYSVRGKTKHALKKGNVTVSRYGNSSTGKATYTVELGKGILGKSFGEKTANGKTYKTTKAVSKGSYTVIVTKNKGENVRVVGEGNIKQ
ncbi:MAG: hypothetical protein ACLTBR_03830 [Anaerostipes sp.]|uniref:hypothetical protein n=1 Tax=Anaerostipes sp. TaxID=1872530 RepID=UPI003991C097